MALGLKGGFALAQSGLTAKVLFSLVAALSMAILMPVLGYLVLRRFLNGFDAAAIAATYGSVSAVTSITAIQYLVLMASTSAVIGLLPSRIVLAVLRANHACQKATASASRGAACSGNAPPGGILHKHGPTARNCCF